LKMPAIRRRVVFRSYRVNCARERSAKHVLAGKRPSVVSMVRAARAARTG
jgi:hypothetical protein